MFAASMSGQWQLAEEYAQVMQVLEARFGASVWPDSHEALMLPFTLVRQNCCLPLVKAIACITRQNPVYCS